LPQQNNGKTMVLHAVATHFKYGIQHPPWQRHELSSVISLSFLDVYACVASPKVPQASTFFPYILIKVLKIARHKILKNLFKRNILDNS
jgi:hypothetical protein